MSSLTLLHRPKLYAFDLDGTILSSEKTLSPENIYALGQIAKSGALIAFASGRIKSSIFKYVEQCSFPISILSLNGALVSMDSRYDYRVVYRSVLPSIFADIIINHAVQNNITLNYYLEDSLYAQKAPYTEKWIDLYIKQTSSNYQFIDSFAPLMGKPPSKLIMVSDPETLDSQQRYFSTLFKNDVYVCRTWDYYLEFLNPDANKGAGLEALAKSYDISMENVIAFGDAENDIPMLQKAAMSIAANNSSDVVKSHAKYVSKWNNNEHIIAKEWKEIQECLKAI